MRPLNSDAASTQRPHIMQGELRQHHQLVHYGKTVVLWHNTTLRHCDRLGALTQGCSSPSRRQLISRGARVPTLSTTWKVFKRKIVRFILLIYSQGDFKPVESLKVNHCDRHVAMGGIRRQCTPNSFCSPQTLSCPDKIFLDIKNKNIFPLMRYPPKP